MNEQYVKEVEQYIKEVEAWHKEGEDLFQQNSTYTHKLAFKVGRWYEKFSHMLDKSRTPNPR